MDKISNSYTRAQGFSLVEMAIAIVVISILLMNVVQHEKVKHEIAMHKQTQEMIQSLKDAALGYAATNKKLPPTIEMFAEPFYDAWGEKIQYTPAPEYLVEISPSSTSSLCIPEESTDCSAAYDKERNLYVAAKFSSVKGGESGYVYENNIKFYIVSIKL